MTITRNSLTDLTQGSYATYSGINTLGNEYDKMYDAVIAEHTIVILEGATHQSELYPRALGFVTNDGVSATLVMVRGVIDDIEAIRNGEGRVILRMGVDEIEFEETVHLEITPTSSTQGYMTSYSFVIPPDPPATFSEVEVYTAIVDLGAGLRTLADADFKFILWTG